MPRRMQRVLISMATIAVLLGPAPARSQASQPTLPQPSAPAARSPSPDRKWTFHDKAMGTQLTVTIWSSDEARAASAASAAFAEFVRLDKLMTTWLPDSDVSRVNAAAGKRPARVTQETFDVIERAQAMSKRSDGAFDITVGAFRGLWKFDEDLDHTLPDSRSVKQRLAKIGWRHVILNKQKRTVFLTKAGMAITLGGIAKGYAVDKAVAIVRAAGHANFIVQAGGDMYVAGTKGDERWQVGIRDPRGSATDMFAAAPLSNHAFSTSGDYERGFVKDGVRYHHILDPRTGQPARATRSVTVYAPDAFTADAWSKALFILGPVITMPWIDADPSLGAVFVDASNQVHVSTSLRDNVTILRAPTDAP